MDGKKLEADSAHVGVEVGGEAEDGAGCGGDGAGGTGHPKADPGHECRQHLADSDFGSEHLQLDSGNGRRECPLREHDPGEKTVLVELDCDAESVTE